MTPPNAVHPLLEPAGEARPAEPAFWEQPASRARPTDKCPRCGALNTADDPRCIGCGTPLGGAPAAPPVNRGRRAARCGLVALLVGAALGPVVGDGVNLVARPPGGPDVNLLLWACLGGGLGAAAGYALGLVRRSPR